MEPELRETAAQGAASQLSPRTAGKGKLWAVRGSLTSPSAACSAPGAAERGGRAVFGMAVDWLGFGYAALVASGGIIGYAKAGSVPSLAAGLFFGSLAGLGAYQVSQNPNNIWVSLDCTIFHLSYIWSTDCHHGNKILPLEKIHACRANCWCQFANGWKISTEDVGKAPGKVTVNFTS
ncbi:uncharacterized protein M8220_008782 isoform 1-T1 [Acridotheres tristis]